MRDLNGIKKRHSRIIDFLTSSYSEGRLVHAYTFFAGSSLDKLFMAKYFSKMLLCESNDTVCETCVSCNLIDEGEHANLITIFPEGKNIKKEQISFLKSDIAKTAIENRAKIYIINEAHKMSISATNSLLKFLEEPAPDTYIILITDSKDNLLPTIISRTVNIAFNAPDIDDLMSYYGELGVEGNLRLIANLSRNKGIDVDFQENNIDELVQLIFKLEESLVTNTSSPSLVIAKNQQLIKELANVKMFSEIYKIYYRDVLDKFLGFDVKSCDVDYEKFLNMTFDNNTINSCVKKLHTILELQSALNNNANVQLALEKMFFEFKKSFD